MSLTSEEKFNKGSKMMLYNIHDQLYHNTKVNEIILGVKGCLGYSNMWHLEEQEKGKNPIAITMQNFIVNMEVKTLLGKDIDASK